MKHFFDKERNSQIRLAQIFSMALYPQRIGQADCRDFLRTGRCKYGESCKYHHPTNVQVGGGIRSPLDPSEPPFPIRPDEPNCQYYLKHGTCKFGQTCKFHHPAHLVGVGSNFSGKHNPAHLCLPVSLNSNSSTGSDVVVLLPQRPSEPDCIYFLRNGRCKYGATCKFHHPISCHGIELSNVNDTNGRSQQVHMDGRINMRGRSYSTGSTHDLSVRNNSGGTATLQFLSNNGNVINATTQHGSSNQAGPTHILVSDSPITVMMSRGSDHTPSMYRTNAGNQILNSQGRSDQNSSSEEQSRPNVAPATMSVLDSSINSASAFEYGGGMASGESNLESQWHRSSSQGNSGSFVPSNRQSGTSRRQSQQHFVMVRRASAADNLYASFGHDSSSNMINVTSSDRRTVSLGSCADLATNASLEGSNAFSSIQRGWESNASLSTASSRCWEGHNFTSNILIPESIESTSSFEKNSGFGDTVTVTEDSDGFKSEDGLTWKTNYEDEISNVKSPMKENPEAQDVLGRSSTDWSSANLTDPNISLGGSRRQNFEDEGLSNMTSALLNMLDKSEDLMQEAESPSPTKMSSSYPNRSSTISFSDPEYVAVGVPSPRQGGVRSLNSLDALRDGDTLRSQNVTEYIKNRNFSSKLSSQFSGETTSAGQLNGNHAIISPPQASPSDIGLYLP